MELLQCIKRDYQDYLRFVKGIYNKYPKYKDGSTPILKQFLYKRGAFCSRLEIMPMMIKKDNEIIATCMYIISKNYEKVLQVAFFEALENHQGAVDLIMEKAKQICKERNLNKIVIGLNGHVNYSIGFLCDKFDAEISFGSSYNPSYYVNYFSKYNPRQYRMVSYSNSMSTLNFAKHQRILERVNDRFNYRSIDFRNFRKEMKVYTELNNICFQHHPFYFPRNADEDYELFRELKLFLREENLIFVQEGDKTVGYLLWYPDFNELLGYGKTIGIGTFMKNKLFSKQIKKMKIVEIAVLSEYQNSGAILGLLYECYKRTSHRYNTCETSWIFESNYKSSNFGLKLLAHEYKHYVTYEIPL